MEFTWLTLATAGLIILFAVIGYHRGLIKELVSALVLVVTIAAVWLINPYVNQFIREHTPIEEKVEEACQSAVQSFFDNAASEGQKTQDELIDSMPLPGVIKDGLRKYNTAEMYKTLGVDGFVSYVAEYLAIMAVNVISFLISFLLTWILLRIVSYVLDIFSKLPVINGVNKVAGAVLGGAKCLVLIWIIMLILTVLCNTEFGQKAMEWIQKDKALTLLYNWNPFTRFFAGLFYGNK